MKITTLACIECSREFEAFKADWCSSNCYGKWRRKHNPEWRKNRRQYERDWKYENDRKLGGYQKKQLNKLRLEQPWCILIRPLKSSAKRRGLEYNLTKEWASHRWTGRCEVTGVEFSSERMGRHVANPLGASIDRIDNSRGYLQDNCRFILHCVNLFKNTMADYQMVEIARMIAATNQIKRVA